MSEIIPQSDATFLKREQFSVSLRTQKKKEIIALKRVRNQQHLSKAKFFLTKQSQDSGLQIKEISHLIEIIEAVDSSLRPKFQEIPEVTFSLEDILQILKEMNHIASSSSKNSKELIGHEASANILLVLLTKDY
jgi:hypothetical protein